MTGSRVSFRCHSPCGTSLSRFDGRGASGCCVVALADDYGGTFEPDDKLREVLAFPEPGLMEWRGGPAGRSSPGTHRSTSREIYRSPEQVMPWPSSWTNL